MKFCDICNKKYKFKKVIDDNKDIKYKYICENCDILKDIDNLEEIGKYIINVENIITNPEKLINDNTIMRTKNYNCNNKNCSTYKDSKLKNAMFFKESNTYRLTYLCLVCNSSWINK